MAEIERATDATGELLHAMNRLLPQLSPNAEPMTMDRLRRLLQAPSTYLYTANLEGEIAGMLTLIVAPIPTGYQGFIEDVVVDHAFRGRGIAEKLVRSALDAARAAGVREVDLTSNPARESANRLYQRIGFQRRETNVYRFLIP